MIKEIDYRLFYPFWKARKYSMTENKTIAILMAAHPRLGNESTLPNDIVVMVARVFRDEARRAE